MDGVRLVSRTGRPSQPLQATAALPPRDAAPDDGADDHAGQPGNGVPGPVRANTNAASPRAQRRQRSPRPRTPALMDTAERRVGQTLGTYRLKEIIGRGGMGTVYKAEHIKLGRAVALKVLLPEFAARRDAVSRFFQEARTVNRIQHRNIVDVTDYVELENGTTFIIMELLDGTSLSDWIDDNRKDTARVLGIFIQICDALSAAHRVGVVHRDLKPDNVIIVQEKGEERVKLLDFGVAKLLYRDEKDYGYGLQTAEGAVMGTPAYMSPEQAGGFPVDARSDIYSLGAIMYELFTDTPLFRGDSFGEYVRKHLNEAPVPPRKTPGGADMDKRLEAAILRCLIKEPERRYAQVDELRDELIAVSDALAAAAQEGRRAARGMSESDIPTEMVTPRPMTVQVQSGGRSAALIAVVLLLGGAGAFGLYIATRGGDDARSSADARSIPPITDEPDEGPRVMPLDDRTPPVQREPIVVRFESEPPSQVFRVGATAPQCETPCDVTISFTDGGSTDRRVFELRREGFQPELVTIDLAAPHTFIQRTLRRKGRTGLVGSDGPGPSGPNNGRGDAGQVARTNPVQDAGPAPAPDAAPRAQPPDAAPRKDVDPEDTLDPFGNRSQ